MEQVHHLLGSEDGTILWWQMLLRAVVVFAFSLTLVRLGGKRIFGKHTAFDIVLGVLLGSNLSRALTGNAPLLSTLLASALLVALHTGAGRLALKSGLVGWLIKGRERPLVEDGRLLTDEMRRGKITDGDLYEAMRLRGIDDLSSVRCAYLERNGDISIVVEDMQERRREHAEQS